MSYDENKNVLWIADKTQAELTTQLLAGSVGGIARDTGNYLQRLHDGSLKILENWTQEEIEALSNSSEGSDGAIQVADGVGGFSDGGLILYGDANGRNLGLPTAGSSLDFDNNDSIAMFGTNSAVICHATNELELYSGDNQNVTITANGTGDIALSTTDSNITVSSGGVDISATNGADISISSSGGGVGIASTDADILLTASGTGVIRTNKVAVGTNEIPQFGQIQTLLNAKANLAGGNQFSGAQNLSATGAPDAGTSIWSMMALGDSAYRTTFQTDGSLVFGTGVSGQWDQRAVLSRKSTGVLQIGTDAIVVEPQLNTAVLESYGVLSAVKQAPGVTPFTKATRTFTTLAGWVVRLGRVWYTTPQLSIQLPNVAGDYLIYFDVATKLLSYSLTMPAWSVGFPIARLIYSEISADEISMGWENHGVRTLNDWYEAAGDHKTVGTLGAICCTPALIDGGQGTSFLGVTGGEIWDEEKESTVGSKPADGTAPWAKFYYSGLTGGVNKLERFPADFASATPTQIQSIIASDIDLGVGSTGRACFNFWNGTSFVPQAIGVNSVVMRHVLANDGILDTTAIVIGQVEYTGSNLAQAIQNARAGAAAEIANIRKSESSARDALHVGSVIINASGQKQWVDSAQTSTVLAPSVAGTSSGGATVPPLSSVLIAGDDAAGRVIKNAGAGVLSGDLVNKGQLDTKQNADPTLTAFAGYTGGAGTFPVFTAVDVTPDAKVVTNAALNVLAGATTAAMLTTLGAQGESALITADTTLAGYYELGYVDLPAGTSNWVQATIQIASRFTNSTLYAFVQRASATQTLTWQLVKTLHTGAGTQAGDGFDPFVQWEILSSPATTIRVHFYQFLGAVNRATTTLQYSASTGAIATNIKTAVFVHASVKPAFTDIVGARIDNPCTAVGQIVYNGVGNIPTALNLGVARTSMMVNSAGTAIEWKDDNCKAVTVSTTGTIASTTGLEVITGDGTITRTLPAANARGAGNCYKIVVKNMSSTACTLSRGGADLLIGFAGVNNVTSVPSAVGQSVIFESNSVDTWFITG